MERKGKRQYGIKRMKELLGRLGYKDIQVKKIGDNDWSAQFARRLAFGPRRNGWNDHVGSPVWDPEWIPVSELERNERYLEIWPTFRERICAETTISHASTGDIINSIGENIGGTTSGPSPVSPASGSKPRKPSTANVRNALAHGLVSIKQEETIAPIEQGQTPIDLTMESPSSPGPPLHGGLDAAAGEQPLEGNYHDPGHIDLTRDDFIDLTIQTVIDLSNVDCPEDTGSKAIDSSALQARESEPPAQQDESDHDSLFDGPEPGVVGDGVRTADNEMEWHTNSENRNLPSVPANQIPTLGHPKIKKGRKRALDFEEPTSGAESTTVEPPHRKRLHRQGPTLLTAERNRMIEKSRNGTFRIYHPESGAGSALALRKQRLSINDGVPSRAAKQKEQVVYTAIHLDMRPSTDPEELADYEEEEEPPARPPRSPTPDPELQALRDKWSQAKMPEAVMKPIAHLLEAGSSLPASSPLGPPLFLLRISQTRTLRLTARNCSKPHTQFFVVTKAEKARRKGLDPAPEQEPDSDISPQPGPAYARHKAHLLDLLPQYHVLAWHASLARQENLRVLMEDAIQRKSMEQLEKLEQEEKKEKEMFWRMGEKEKTQVLPRSAKIADAENVLFNQYCDTPSKEISWYITDPLMRRVGSYAELVLHQHGWIGPSKQDQHDYARVAETLGKTEKFLVIDYEMVNEHYNCPHTLIVFASKSRRMGELFGLPEDMMKSRRSLVIVHLGWRLTEMVEGKLPIFHMK